MINNNYFYNSTLKSGCLCHERWMPMPRTVDAYAVKGGCLCRLVMTFLA